MANHPIDRTDFKYEESLIHNGKRDDIFRVYIVETDNNETIEDDQKTPRFVHASKKNPNRGFHVSGIRADGKGKQIIQVRVPGNVGGDFKLPQPGDVVWARQGSEGGDNMAFLMHNDYSGDNFKDTHILSNPAPLWGSMPGDFGHMRSYKDHSLQFSPKITQHKYTIYPKEPSNFRRKWVRSISGYRWRSFYKGNVLPTLFVMRGDNVFDLDFSNMAKGHIEEDGLKIMLEETPQYAYPDPNNGVEVREKDSDFTYIWKKHLYTKKEQRPDPNEDGIYIPPKEEFFPFTHKVKHYFSYEPILDKTYKKKTKGFERELVAVREYAHVFYGNNKLLFQDVHGDGEQILLTLKNQYDAGFTIVHDTERSQVRLRDHLGNTILIDGNPDKPRIIMTTKDRRVVEIGDMPKKGSSKGFLYLRNGKGYGNAQVPWGRITNKSRGDVFNQELVMVDDLAVIRDPEFLGRLSPIMRTQLRGPGIYMRTVADGEKPYEKRFSTYELDDILVENSIEAWLDTDTWTTYQTLVKKDYHEYFMWGKTLGVPLNLIKFNDEYMHFERIKDKDYIHMDGNGIQIDAEMPIKVRSGTEIELRAPVINLNDGTYVPNPRDWDIKTLPITPKESPYVGFNKMADTDSESEESTAETPPEEDTGTEMP